MDWRSLLLSLGITGLGGCLGLNQRSTADPASGNKPPWLRTDGPASTADIVVEKAGALRTKQLEFELTIDEHTRTIVIDAEPNYWHSEDIIDSGATPTITLSLADGRRREFEWQGEKQNEGVLDYSVSENEIRARMISRNNELSNYGTTEES